MSIYTPRIIESKSTINWRSWYIISLILGLILLGLFYLGVRWFFFPLYGLDYTDSYTILLLVMPIAIFFPARALAENYLTINHWNWSLIILNLATNILGIVFLFTAWYFLSFIQVAAGYFLITMIFHITIVTRLFWHATAPPPISLTQQRKHLA